MRWTPLLALTAFTACSADGVEGGAGGAGGSSSAAAGGGGGLQGGAGTSDEIVGSFSVVLNPAIDESGPYTSVFGKVYASAYPTDVIATAIAHSDDCTVYRFSLQFCSSPCSTGESCVGSDVCRKIPSAVSVGAVSLSGIGDTLLELSAINNNYQFAGEIAYPGFADGDALTLSATGEHFPAYAITAQGVAPSVLHAPSYLLTPGSALDLRWEPGSAAVDARVSILLNISKHGGSAGYLECQVADSGALTIPADVVSALIDLGVAGFPQLTFRRSTRGQASVPGGVIVFEVASLAVPTLGVSGYCSCFNASDCGACDDKSKTACDSLKRLCHAP